MTKCKCKWNLLITKRLLYLLYHCRPHVLTLECLRLGCRWGDYFTGGGLDSKVLCIILCSFDTPALWELLEGSRGHGIPWGHLELGHLEISLLLEYFENNYTFDREPV